ncbi:MAG: hypothetical protein RLZZ502_1145 [Pseudomonadota bacterium]|jgi:arginine-tRNA-protein transferase
MSAFADLPVARVQYYTTAPYPCSYVPGQTARSLVATPLFRLEMGTFAHLVYLGFRRSGHFVYRPKCVDCQACTPTRVAVFDFAATRAQKRVSRQHDSLTAKLLPTGFVHEHFELYQRYQRHRHEGGGMDGDNEEQYRQYMLQSSVDTVLVEFREAGVLRMVSIVDVLPDGISANYTFFDPEVRGSSFGTYAILWQIAYARALGLPYLYLGYWVDGSRKMRYKANFNPQERLLDGHWQRLAH